MHFSLPLFAYSDPLPKFSFNVQANHPEKTTTLSCLSLAQTLFPKTKAPIAELDEVTTREFESLRKLILGQSMLRMDEGKLGFVSLNSQVPRFTLPPLANTTSRSTSGTFLSVIGNEEEERVGAYTRSQRRRKIQNYKEKLKRRRATHPIVRKFEGRRKIAFTKQRLNGRFTKACHKFKEIAVDKEKCSLY